MVNRRKTIKSLSFSSSGQGEELTLETSALW